MANFEKNKIEKIFLNRMKSWDRSINIDNHSFILPYRTYNNILINSPLKQDYLNLLSSKFGNIVFVLRQNDSDSWEEKPLSSLKKLRSDRDKFLFFHDANKNIFQVGSKYKEKASPLSLCKSTSLRQMSIDHDISLKKIIEVDKKQFPNLLTISLIAEKWLEKSNANKTNANIKKLASHNAFLTKILSKINLREFFIEIEKLFNNNRLVVMQKRDNISKNCS